MWAVRASFESAEAWDRLKCIDRQDIVLLRRGEHGKPGLRARQHWRGGNKYLDEGDEKRNRIR